MHLKNNKSKLQLELYTFAATTSMTLCVVVNKKK